MDSEYKTPNIHLAAWLLSCGLRIIKVDSKNGKKFFVFNDDGRIEEYIHAFNNDRFIKSFINNLNYVKKLIFSR